MKFSDIKKAKLAHDKKISLSRQIKPGEPIDKETDWKCLNTSRGRMEKNLNANVSEKSFFEALDTAEGAEIFTVWEKGDTDEWKVILKNLKDNWRQDHKFINAPLGAGFEVGNTVTWSRISERWLIVWQDFSFSSYFRGEMQRATHRIRWKNKHGQIVEQWAVVQGPIETQAKYEQTRGNVVTGRQNDTLEVLMGANEGKEIRDLLRYNRIKVGTRTWRINVVDDISEVNILRFSCKEDFNNEAIDDIVELIPGGKEDFSENEVSPSELGVRIVGPAYLREALVSNLYAINEETQEVISSLGSWSVESSNPKGVEKYYTKEDGSLNVISRKMGDIVDIKFTLLEGGKENSVSLQTKSMFS